MNDTAIVDVLRHMLTTGTKVVGPVLLVALVVGVAVSLVQTITQVQEQSVAFVLKLASVALVFLVAGPWMLQTLQSFIVQLWSGIGPGI